MKGLTIFSLLLNDYIAFHLIENKIEIIFKLDLTMLDDTRKRSEVIVITIKSFPTDVTWICTRGWRGGDHKIGKFITPTDTNM